MIKSIFKFILAVIISAAILQIQLVFVLFRVVPLNIVNIIFICSVFLIILNNDFELKLMFTFAAAFMSELFNSGFTGLIFLSFIFSALVANYAKKNFFTNLTYLSVLFVIFIALFAKLLFEYLIYFAYSIFSNDLVFSNYVNLSWDLMVLSASVIFSFLLFFILRLIFRRLNPAYISSERFVI